MYSLKNKIVIITGASDGIGYALAREVAYRGAIVVLVARGEEKLKQVEEKIRSEKGDAFSIACDVSSKDSVGALVKQVIEKYGKIDVVINNAAVGLFEDIARSDESDTRALFDTNFFGPLTLIQEALPHMRQKKDGLIINISSAISKYALFHQGVYAASKAALERITEALSVEEEKNGIHTLLVIPDRTKTKFKEHILGTKDNANLPLKLSEATPKDVARKIAHAIERGKYIYYTSLRGWLFSMVAIFLPLLVRFGAKKSYDKVNESDSQQSTVIGHQTRVISQQSSANSHQPSVSNHQSKVMVTGALGWLGSRLTLRLVKSGRRVICVDSWKGEWPLLPHCLRGVENIEIAKGDIRSPELFREKFSECETIFNCAGAQHPKHTKEIYEVNRDAPAKLFKYAEGKGVKTFVHISSSAVHGESENTEIPITEETPLCPITHYNRSKAEGEKLLRAVAENSLMKMVIIRPGVFYGENPSRNFVQLIHDMKRGMPLPVFGKEGKLRMYVDIEKVVDALMLAEKMGKNREAYLIADTKPMATKEFYESIGNAIDVKPHIIALPTFFSRIVELIAYGAGKANIHARIPTALGEFGRHHYFSSEKAKKELEFKPHASSREGLKRMVEWSSQCFDNWC